MLFVNLHVVAQQEYKQCNILFTVLLTAAPIQNDKKAERLLKHWHMGTDLKVLS